MGEINTLKIYDSIFELILHCVKIWSGSGFNKSIMDLLCINLMENLRRLNSTETSKSFMRISELFTVGLSISYMENIPENWSSWKFNPIKFFTAMHQAIMNSFGLITSSISLKLINVLSSFMSICKIESLSNIC